MLTLFPTGPALGVFLLACLAVGASPGPGMLYVVARSVGQGRRAGLVSVLGLSAGSFLNCLAAALGLSALLAVSALAFDAVRLAGAAYLGYLAWRTLAAGDAGAAEVAAPRDPAGTIFRQAMLTNVVNPKSALFYLSFVPQFTDPARGPVLAQFIALGLVFNVLGNSINLAVGWGFGTIGDWLARHPGFRRGQRWFTASVFLALAAHLALLGRRA